MACFGGGARLTLPRNTIWTLRGPFLAPVVLLVCTSVSSSSTDKDYRGLRRRTVYTWRGLKSASGISMPVPL
ncbi:hypothetical protein Mapa_015246 [Marchantia paleacea]|nr:hypothetical protein Mapa_015246 [Marchantia paleacea]